MQAACVGKSAGKTSGYISPVASPFEGTLAGILQFSIDSAMMYQCGCCGVDELGQAAG